MPHISSVSHSRRSQLTQRAAAMRCTPTTSEEVLFQALRGGRAGVAFRRHVPLLGRFIVDLLAPKVKLVIEVDGGWHEGRERLDERRDWALVSAGYHVLRLDAADVMADVDAAVARVGAEVALLR